LARKSGVKEQTVKSLIEMIHEILSRKAINQDELKSLNKLLEIFYRKK